jgi:exoribonuclease R
MTRAGRAAVRLDGMRQLLVYGFPPGASFQGQLVGALERLESGGTLRVVDALFVVSDAESGEVAAIDLREHSASAALGRMLSFRLDERERRKATERALEADAVRDLAATLEPGAAVAALLVEHVWAGALEDAVARSGGAALLDRRVDAEALADVRADLVAAAR